MKFRLTKRYCNYIDWTLEEVPRVFYVGEGNQKRVNNGKRNHVHAGLAKRFGMRREMIEEFDDRTEALKLETERILFYGTFAPETGWGANLRLRTSSPTGVKPSAESNAKRSAALKGRKKGVFTEEHIANMKASFKTRPKPSAETIAKRSAKLRGRTLSEKHKAHLKEMWKRDDYRANVTNAVKAAYADPELRKQHGVLSVREKARKRFRRLASSWFKRLLMPVPR